MARNIAMLLTVIPALHPAYSACLLSILLEAYAKCRPIKEKNPANVILSKQISVVFAPEKG